MLDEKGSRVSGSLHIQAAEQYGFVSYIDQFTLTNATRLLEDDKNLISSH